MGGELDAKGIAKAVKGSDVGSELFIRGVGDSGRQRVRLAFTNLFLNLLHNSFDIDPLQVVHDRLPLHGIGSCDGMHPLPEQHLSQRRILFIDAESL